MKGSDFEGLMQGLKEAHAYARGRTVKGIKVNVPDVVDVAAIRKATGLTQVEFSSQIGVSSATVRNWEQKRRAPEGPARVLLALLARDPNIVKRMLKPAA